MGARTGEPEGVASVGTRSRSGRIDRRVRIRYLVIGALLGAAWGWNGDLPPWSHAVRLGILIVVVLPLFALGRRWWFRRTGRTDTADSNAHLRGWLVAKVALVAGAFVAQVALERWLTRSASAEVVGLGLFAVVAVAGPMLHERLVVGWRRPARAAAD